jgi:probable HAF family extracellular repeat protein
MRRHAIPHRGLFPPYWSVAHAINAAGQAVSWSGTASWSSHAVLWDGGQVTDLDTPPDHGWSEATAINEAGQVAGVTGGGGAGASLAVVWDGGQLTELDPLPRD